MTLVLLIVGVIVAAPILIEQFKDDPVYVHRVIDGDTIDVSQGDEIRRVRLLNVDTPEVGRNGKASECLADEATDFTKTLLPEGTEVELKYDVEKKDKYDRDLAGVFVGNLFINAEIAKEGLGVAVEFAPNHKFYPQVALAEARARHRGVGLSTLSPECFVDNPDLGPTVDQAHDSIQTAQAIALDRISDGAVYSQAIDVVEDLNDAERALTKLTGTSLTQTRFQQHAHPDGIDEAERYIKETLASVRDARDQLRAAVKTEREAREKGPRLNATGR